MTNALYPLEIVPGEWVITSGDGYEKYGYEQFSNITYPSRDACQKRIDALNAALSDLLMAAADVVDCWNGGDLAGAVRELNQVLETAWGSS
jgi:hypothetical protein